MLGLEKRLLLREVKKLLKNDENIVILSDKNIRTKGNTTNNIKNIKRASRILQRIEEALGC